MESLRDSERSPTKEEEGNSLGLSNDVLGKERNCKESVVVVKKGRGLVQRLRDLGLSISDDVTLIKLLKSKSTKRKVKLRKL